MPAEDPYYAHVKAQQEQVCFSVCCSALRRVAIYCDVLQCVAMCCCALRRVAVCSDVLQSVAVCYGVLHCVFPCVAA